jgi:hypothetical protein
VSAPVAPEGTYFSATGRKLSRTNAAIRAMQVGDVLFIRGKTSAQIGGRLRPTGAFVTCKAQQDGVWGVLVTRKLGPAATERLNQRVPQLLALVTKAAQQFEFYAEQHAAKNTPEADAKAQVNRDLAAEMRAGVAEAVGGAPA